MGLDIYSRTVLKSIQSNRKFSNSLNISFNTPRNSSSERSFQKERSITVNGKSEEFVLSKTLYSSSIFIKRRNKGNSELPA